MVCVEVFSIQHVQVLVLVVMATVRLPIVCASILMKTNKTCL